MVWWCMYDAQSRLREPNHRACKAAAARHGFDKSQNDMGFSAIRELCRGNDAQAEEYIRACQCHNPGVMPKVMQTWSYLREYALQHPVCQQDTCLREGGEWRDSTCMTKKAEDLAPTVPAQRVIDTHFVAADIMCRSPSGSTGHVNRVVGDTSCQAAKQKLDAWAREADRCSEANNLLKMTHIEWRNTETCIVK